MYRPSTRWQVPSGGGGGAAAPAAAAGGAAPAAAEEEKEEQKEDKVRFRYRVRFTITERRAGRIRRRHGLWSVRLKVVVLV